MKEKYYAVRIGDPRRHSPYFMIRKDSSCTPVLFLTRREAQKNLPDEPAVKVVRVWLTTT